MDYKILGGFNLDNNQMVIAGCSAVFGLLVWIIKTWFTEQREARLSREKLTVEESIRRDKAEEAERLVAKEERAYQRATDKVSIQTLIQEMRKLVEAMHETTVVELQRNTQQQTIATETKEFFIRLSAKTDIIGKDITIMKEQVSMCPHLRFIKSQEDKERTNENNS